MKTFLHVGCGPKRKNETTRVFASEDWLEERLDINPSVLPDVVGTMTEMSAVPTSSVQAVFSSHNIEHLYPHEVPRALSEFLRVLTDDGYVVITCPDLQSVCQLVAEDKLTETEHVSTAGSIAAIDVLYGHRLAMAQGNLYMAHRCGFTRKVLMGSLHAAGFKSIAAVARPKKFELWAVATKEVLEEQELRGLAEAHFPEA